MEFRSNDEDTTFQELKILLDFCEKTKECNKGRWNQDEQSVFIKAFKLYGSNWALIQKMVKTRTTKQVKSHAQKFLKNLLAKISPDIESLINYKNKKLQTNLKLKKKKAIKDRIHKSESKIESFPFKILPIEMDIDSDTNMTKEENSTFEKQMKTYEPSQEAQQAGEEQFIEVLEDEPYQDSYSEIFKLAHFEDNLKNIFEY